MKYWRSKSLEESHTYRYLTQADSKSHKIIAPFALPVAIKLNPSAFKTSKHCISTAGTKFCKEH